MYISVTDIFYIEKSLSTVLITLGVETLTWNIRVRPGLQENIHEHWHLTQHSFLQGRAIEMVGGWADTHRHQIW